MHSIDGLVEADEGEVGQQDLLHPQHVNVDGLWCLYTNPLCSTHTLQGSYQCVRCWRHAPRRWSRRSRRRRYQAARPTSPQHNNVDGLGYPCINLLCSAHPRGLTGVSVVGDMYPVDGVVEADEGDVWQRDLLHPQHVDVDRALVLARAFTVALAPVGWTCKPF